MAISPSGSTTNALAGDIGSISRLRNSASADPRAAIKEASKQFESIFMQQLLKGMRDANETMSPGMFDNAGTKMGTEMLDQQYAKEMTGRPGGLAELIERQLQRQLGDPVANIASEAAANPAKPDPAPRSFIGRMFSRDAAPASSVTKPSVYHSGDRRRDGAPHLFPEAPPCSSSTGWLDLTCSVSMKACRNSPRISAGASGFMSNVSSWLGAPRLKMRMHARSPTTTRTMG